MERENFEGSWRDAFEGAEVTPSDKVWTNIELELEKEKGDDLKKRLVFFQMLAAASVVFALAIGGGAVYFDADPVIQGDNLAAHATEAPATPLTSPGAISGDTPGTEENVSPDKIENQQSKSAVISGSSGDAVAKTKPAERKALTRDADSGAGREAGINVEAIAQSTEVTSEDASVFRRGTTGSDELDSEGITQAVVMSSEQRRATIAGTLPRTIDERELPELYTPRQVQLTFDPQTDTETVDPVVAMLARLEQREREVQTAEEKKNEKEEMNERLWTSIGFAAGSFNSMQSSGASASPGTAMALAAPIVDQETKASGYSYSMGVNVGTRIAERWVLQGGLNYLTHASEYTANNVVMSTANYQQQRFRAASTTELMKGDAEDLSSKLVYSAPYNVNNSMRYLSVPLQAGYLVVNKTFGLQINAGVATDLFLQNTISADSEQLDKTSQPGGDDSPYRSVNLSGLFGTELSYRFGPHYRVSLNPGLRYPFNTIYKSELGVEATPLTFDVGLRFRYIFR